MHRWRTRSVEREPSLGISNDRINGLQLFQSPARIAVVPGSRRHSGGHKMGRANREVGIKVS
jgi:hypothetical protein